ncbi:WD40 repeat domain-containing protein [Nocardia pseudovaccinii]|uniref:WD40 repeat domain-containing protein n=1 Tax=Nocardia pseudovaccinii TaxID=189540 RepID=UPI003D90A641
MRTVTGLVFTDDGDRLAVSDAEYIVQLDIGATGLTKTMGNPWPYYHRPLAVSLSKHTMARIKATVLAGETPIGGQVELWPVGTVGPVGGSGAYELPGPGSTGSKVVFDRAGTVLAVGGLDGSLTLWDPLADYAHRRSLPVSAHASAVSAIAFTADGQLAMSAGYDGTLTAWLISDSGPFRLGGLIQAHTGEVTRIAFSADNRTVFTTGHDGMLRSWEISRLIDLLADPTRMACALSGGGLEREAWTTFVVNQPYRETCS